MPNEEPRSVNAPPLLEMDSVPSSRAVPAGQSSKKSKLLMIGAGVCALLAVAAVSLSLLVGAGVVSFGETVADNVEMKSVNIRDGGSDHRYTGEREKVSEGAEG